MPLAACRCLACPPIQHRSPIICHLYTAPGPPAPRPSCRHSCRPECRHRHRPAPPSAPRPACRHPCRSACRPRPLHRCSLPLPRHLSLPLRLPCPRLRRPGPPGPHLSPGAALHPLVGPGSSSVSSACKSQRSNAYHGPGTGPDAAVQAQPHKIPELLTCHHHTSPPPPPLPAGPAACLLVVCPKPFVRAIALNGEDVSLTGPCASGNIPMLTLPIRRRSY
jgi:hypothetical protein